MMNSKKIKIQDTTLRDGEQTPGIAFNLSNKLKIFEILEKIGVDTIEVGFPAASIEEEKIIKNLCNKVSKKHTTICVFARSLEKDILIAREATKSINNVKLQIVMPVSDLQIEYSINKNKDQIIIQIKEIIKLAKKYFNNIQFTAQDCTRADIRFLKKSLKVAVQSGASSLCLPDTTGFSTPLEYSKLIKEIKKQFVNNKEIKISAHCHNDLGLATANTLAAIGSGADQIECTIGGLGERAGNAPLEEIIAILNLKYKDVLSKKINLKYFNRAKKLIESISKIKMHDNKPIFGTNVFTHASGMHQKAIIKNRKSFEIIKAESFGIKGGIVRFGKLSGRSALIKILNENNFSFKTINFEKVIPILKKEAEKKKILSFPDIKKIISMVK
ncbi:MAG: hypothetical protein CBC22_03710 [Alphaproteobacteria bacterium TMED62]|nr:MAG: hypothetical protein CBC22_03710 [Alphaproteobacteria bacterium TMED62]